MKGNSIKRLTGKVYFVQRAVYTQGYTAHVHAPTHTASMSP